MQNVKLLVAIVGAFGFLFGCVKEIRTEPTAQPLAVKSCDQSAGTCMTIKKASLGNRFLLVPNAKLMNATPTWEAFRPQIVSFRQEGSFISMYEENTSTVYDDIKVQGLQQKFKIESEDGEQFQVAFGEGFRVLKLIFHFEMPMVLGGPIANNSVIETLDSIVKSSSQSGDKIEIVQSVRMALATATNGTNAASSSNPLRQAQEIPGDIIWQIYPYVPNSAFKRISPDPYRRVGFFTSSLQEKSFKSAMNVSIVHWDLGKPIYAKVSTSVPQAYREAVKAGLEYWNRVLGKDLIKVEFVDEDKMSPGLGVVLVHWQKWDDGNGAVAKPQVDPLTGELLGGHIDISEVFISDKQKRDLVKENSAGFSEFNHICDLPTKVDFRDMTPKEKDDFTAWVTAHEMGHMMGLRHNFAGTFSNGKSEVQLNESYADYKQTGVSKAFASTSVMDYMLGRDAVLTGSYIRARALPYDQMAMRYASEIGWPDFDVSQYCTDEDISMPSLSGDASGVVYGCARFDSGANPLEVQIGNFEKTRSTLLLKSYLSRARLILDANAVHVRLAEMKGLYNTMRGDFYSLPASLVEPIVFMSAAITKTKKNNISRIVSLDLVQNAIKAIEGRLLPIVHSGILLSQKDVVFDKTYSDHVTQVGGPASVLKTALVFDGAGPKRGWIAEQARALSESPLWNHIEFEDGAIFELAPADKQQIIDDFTKNSDALELDYRKNVLSSFFPKITLSDGNSTPVAASTTDLTFLEMQPWLRSDQAAIQAVTEVLEAVLFYSLEKVTGQYGPAQARASIELPKYQYRGTDLPSSLFAVYTFSYIQGSNSDSVDYMQIFNRRTALKEKILVGIRNVFLKIDPSLEPDLQTTSLVDAAKLKVLMEKLPSFDMDTTLKNWLSKEIQLYAYICNLY